ncbi:hypothetical protein DFH08DRAFT_800387 [Mycena albidolilacea]|uniref:Uncharacterized protein n=1 Tax=Mycena albidolilacea TaxID=1033008 RepID=A0AAD7AJV8_9AGAR|nr:hypothetical protein DFH08DRAFT_800387 [Mycena albidolilacea]
MVGKIKVCRRCMRSLGGTLGGTALNAELLGHRRNNASGPRLDVLQAGNEKNQEKPPRGTGPVGVCLTGRPLARLQTIGVVNAARIQATNGRPSLVRRIRTASVMADYCRVMFEAWTRVTGLEAHPDVVRRRCAAAIVIGGASYAQGLLEARLDVHFVPSSASNNTKGATNVAGIPYDAGHVTVQRDGLIWDRGRAAGHVGPTIGAAPRQVFTSIGRVRGADEQDVKKRILLRRIIVLLTVRDMSTNKRDIDVCPKTTDAGENLEKSRERRTQL